MLGRLAWTVLLAGCFSWEPSTSSDSTGVSDTAGSASVSVGSGAGGTGAGASGGGGNGGASNVDTCAGFDTAWKPSLACNAVSDGGGFPLLNQFQSDFATAPTFITEWGDCAGQNLSYGLGQLTITDCDADSAGGGGGAGGAAGAGGPLSVYAVTPLGSTRGCEVTATVAAVPTSGAFTLRHDVDVDGAGGQAPSAEGTIHMSIKKAALGDYEIEVARYGGGGTATTLGNRGGYALPVKVFIANDSGERVCAGTVKGTTRDCIGCWAGDAKTTQLIDSGRVLMTTQDSISFDDLNVP